MCMTAVHVNRPINKFGTPRFSDHATRKLLFAILYSRDGQVDVCVGTIPAESINGPLNQYKLLAFYQSGMNTGLGGWQTIVEHFSLYYKTFVLRASLICTTTTTTTTNIAATRHHQVQSIAHTGITIQSWYVYLFYYELQKLCYQFDLRRKWHHNEKEQCSSPFRCFSFGTQCIIYTLLIHHYYC